MTTEFPNFDCPPIFFSVASGTKFRIMLGRNSTGTSRPRLTQIATVPGDSASADTLTELLNQATWSGQTAALESVIGGLPDPVRQACLDAVARCREGRVLPIGNNGLPMTTVRQLIVTTPTEAAEIVTSAANLGLLATVTNQMDERQLEYVVSVLSDEVQVSSMEAAFKWPDSQEGRTTLSTDACSEGDLADSIGRDRWHSFSSRCFWVWVTDQGDAGSATMEFVVQTFDEPIDESSQTIQFVAQPVEQDDGPLTQRNRFLVWMALHNLTADLGGLQSESDLEYSVVRDALPRLVRDQPLAWWKRMYQSAERLTEAARTGDIAALVPRTAAEEALIFLATLPGHLDWARDTIDLYDLNFILDALPSDDDWDGEFNEVLPALTGDVDIEMLWNPELDGVEDPNSTENQSLGMGDYRPDAWHTEFRGSDVAE